MVKFILIITLIFITLSSFSQEDTVSKNHGFIGIGVGASLPISNFASNISSNNDAGYALTGYNYNFNFNYVLYNNIGIALTAFRSYNAFDDKMVFNEINEIKPNYKFELSSTDWINTAGLGGLLINFPSGKSDFYIKGLLGYSLNNSPSFDLLISDEKKEITLNQKSDKSNCYVIMLCTGMRFKIYENASFFINMDYFSARPKFNLEITSNSQETKIIETKQKINIINLNFGVGINIK